jgi:uncharacterized protein
VTADSAAVTTSSATVATDRPGRYGKQLASHLGRRVSSTWDDDAGTGEVTLPFGRAELTAQEDALHLFVAGSPDAEPGLQGVAGLDRLEDVVGRHLVRFGTKDELVVQWQRSDGSPGSRQQLTE